MIDVTKKSVILIQQGRRQTFTMLHCFIIYSDEFFFTFEIQVVFALKKLDGPLAKYAPTNSPIDVMLKKAKNTKIDMEQVAASNSSFKVS